MTLTLDFEPDNKESLKTAKRDHDKNMVEHCLPLTNLAKVKNIYAKKHGRSSNGSSMRTQTYRQ